MCGDDPGNQPLPPAFWDALRDDEAEPHAVERAYRRFSAASRPLFPPRLMLARWLLGGFALGWGVVYAATGDPFFGARVRTVWDTTPSDPASVPATPRKWPGVARRPEPSTSSSAPAPAAVEVVARPPAVLPEPAPSVARREKPPSVLAPLPPNDGRTTDPTWERAALALRTHDYDAAENALSDLEAHGSAPARDAASLALAEVLLARGRTDAALARLQRLSVAGRTPLTRDKARALLGTASSSSDRSTSAAPATH